MNNKLFSLILTFLGATLTASSQTPNLQAVTTQGNTTTNGISIQNKDGLCFSADPVNGNIWTHYLRPSAADPGVLRFDCTSNTVASGWEFYNSDKDKSLMYIRQNPGFIGIGTVNPKVRLAVNGEILSKKIRVTPNNWADFVFDSSYVLPSLKEVAAFIAAHKHLPGMPSAKEISENDLDLGQQQAKLLQQIEEMTLYLIAQQKRLYAREQQINKRQQLLADRERRLAALEAAAENE